MGELQSIRYASHALTEYCGVDLLRSMVFFWARVTILLHFVVRAAYQVQFGLAASSCSSLLIGFSLGGSPDHMAVGGSVRIGICVTGLLFQGICLGI